MNRWIERKLKENRDFFAAAVSAYAEEGDEAALLAAWCTGAATFGDNRFGLMGYAAWVGESLRDKAPAKCEALERLQQRLAQQVIPEGQLKKELKALDPKYARAFGLRDPRIFHERHPKLTVLPYDEAIRQIEAKNQAFEPIYGLPIVKALREETSQQFSAEIAGKTQREVGIRWCRQCRLKVWMRPDGTCPACHTIVDDAPHQTAAAADVGQSSATDDGASIPVDQEALRELKAKAQAGDAEAQHNLGVTYDKGHGVPRDLAAAVNWYRKAAEQGFPASQYNLGLLYAHGEGVEQDLATAINWYAKAAEQGLAEAQYNLGVKCVRGEDVPKDPVAAVQWWQKAARQGYANAQYNLGSMYEKGQGVPQDFVAAADWWRQAAEQGRPEAQSNLGLLYERGTGVPKNPATAVIWYRKAAEQEFANAQHNLALMYADGVGLPKDLATAAGWYRKAAEQGHPIAQFNLGVAYAEGSGVPKDPASAVFWCRKAAEQGLGEAQVDLGVKYFNGQGVPTDLGAAYMWFDIAVAQGFEAASNHRETVGKQLSPQEIARVQQLAREWKPKK